MKEHWRNSILVLSLTLVLFVPVTEIPAVGHQQHPGPRTSKRRSAVVIDLTGPVERSQARLHLLDSQWVVYPETSRCTTPFLFA
jgi:hypothetical protein